MTQGPGEKRLTDRQRRFVEEYLIDLKAGAAAARAGYSAKSAETLGTRLRNLPHVHAAIEAAMAERRRRVGITQDRVVTELARLAFADIHDFADWDNHDVTLKPARDLTPDQTACVAEIVQTPGKGLRIKLHGKTQALAALARHLGSKERTEEGREVAPAITVVTCVPPPDLPPDERLCQGPPSQAGEGGAAGNP